MDYFHELLFLFGFDEASRHDDVGDGDLFCLGAGLWVAKRRGPEVKEIEKADSEMSMILYLAQASHPEMNIYFRRPREEMICDVGPPGNEVYVTFSSPRKGIPVKCGANDFRFTQGNRGSTITLSLC